MMSWEIKEQRKVMLYSIHCESTTMQWAAAFKKLILPGDFHFYTGMPYDHCRNTAVQNFLQSPYEWLFSLDSDVLAPPDAILRLLSHGQPIISGLYSRRSPPHGVPVMIRNGQWVTSYSPGSVIEVDMVGAGCLLVHRSVFEKVPPQRPGKPFYDWRVDLKGTGVVPEETCLSEDFSWNIHCRRHGYKILVDTGCVCKHIGAAEFTHGNVEPLKPVA